LEEKCLLLTGYKFMLSDPNAIVNRSPPRCMAVYQAALSYSLHFPLYELILEILNRCELAIA